MSHYKSNLFISLDIHRKSKLSRVLSSKQILKSTIPLKLLRRLVSPALSVQNVLITIGDTLKNETLAATQSKLTKASKYNSCIGQYTFINDGVGKGHKMTFAEAWKGKN